MQPLIKVENLKTTLDSRLIHDGLNLHINQGEIYGILGPSGCGKTTLLREMVLLEKFSSGEITVLGEKLSEIHYNHAQALRKQWGVLFQAGALFSSLNVFDNIALPLYEYTDLSPKLIEEIVQFKIHIVGLRQSDAMLFPSQMSGGMKKKASLARALAMDPKLLFLDEPTSGLDPISARDFDALIMRLRSLLDVTIVMVSHDLESIYATLDRVAIIDEKKIVYEGSIKDVHTHESQFIQTFFGTKR
jgi:phospholipid/cholesterol/gamma-HCH transport system ATP-binding protein